MMNHCKISDLAEDLYLNKKVEKSSKMCTNWQAAENVCLRNRNTKNG